MYLRTLTFQAIGPFAGRHTIDFAELAVSGLFLLEGPTGAGKSTLIDAVVFALYGTVASAQASDERLRSTAAAPDTESFVDLVFEVPSGQFRVRRSPQYERTKLRGEGTTTQQATVRAWRMPADTPTGAPPDELDRYGEPVGNRLDEVGQLVQGWVGLDRQQFVQTVVLPQGEFASFLRAKPEDRRLLLQKIFGTQVYEDLTDRLAQLRRDANNAVTAACGELGESTSHLVGAARLDDEDGAALRAELDTLMTDARAAAARPDGPDPVALAVLEETAEYLGAGLSDLINLFQPERILIGGWAGLQLGARFLPAVRRYATTYALRHPAEQVTIDLGRLGPDAVTVGAAILPLADFFSRGGRRAEPATEDRLPAWRMALEERTPR